MSSYSSSLICFPCGRFSTIRNKAAMWNECTGYREPLSTEVSTRFVLSAKADDF
jgi:hypothetical protein